VVVADQASESKAWLAKISLCVKRNGILQRN